jgi:hypothetical protein
LKRHFGSAGGWHWQISNRNPTDDAAAFEEFFCFLEVFKDSVTHKKYVIVDETAVKFSKGSGVTRRLVVNGAEGPVMQAPSKIILTTIDNSTTVWLDYIVENDDVNSTDSWFISLDEAMDRLKGEFGCFQNEWITVDNGL